MEIHGSNRPRNLPIVHSDLGDYQLLPAVQQRNDEFAQEVIRRCGNARTYFARYMNQDNLISIAAHRRNAVVDGLDFPIVQLMQVYGQSTIEEFLKIFAGLLCQALGLDWDNCEKTQFAIILANTQEARRLPMGYLVSFLKWISEGRRTFYAGRPVHIMQCFQEYVKIVDAEAEQAIEERARMLEKQKKDAEHKAEPTITFAEYKRRAGIPDDVSILDYLHRRDPGSQVT